MLLRFPVLQLMEDRQAMFAMLIQEYWKSAGLPYDLLQVYCSAK
jgi:hypothetical protein